MSISIVNIAILITIIQANLVSSFSGTPCCCTSNLKRRNIITLNEKIENDDERFAHSAVSDSKIEMKGRREIIQLAMMTWCTSSAIAAENLKAGETLMYTTNSGLRFIELKEGTGIMPNYGEFIDSAKSTEEL